MTGRCPLLKERVTIMEPFVADFLLNKKIPKPVRYAAAGLITGLILFICIFAGVASPYIIGKVVCFTIAALMGAMCAGVFIKIHRN